MSEQKKAHYGIELLFNEFQLAGQNFYRLTILALLGGLLISLIFFALFAPRNWFEVINVYFYSWLYCKIPFGCSPEAINNMRLLSSDLTKVGRAFSVSKYIFALGSLGTGIYLKYYFADQSKRFTQNDYLRGAKLLLPQDLQEEIEAKYQPDESDLLIGKEQIRIPGTMTYRHVSMAGASGVGKTQAINSLLKQLETRPKHKIFVVDLNGQYYARFGKPGDKILSLYDKRSEYWDFWHDGAPPEFYAEALIEMSDKDKFFGAAGRALLTDLLRINNDIGDLWKDLTSGAEKLLPKLKGGISPALIGAPEQAAGVVATASLQLNFLQYLNHWSQEKAEKPFSIVDWASSDDLEDNSWVYLVVRDRDLSASKALLRTWYDLATLGVLQRDENNEYPHLWLLADELPGLGKLPSLGKLLSQGRKYRASAVVGYQSSEQIKDVYGREGAGEIFQGLQVKMIYRCSDPDTAKHTSQELGEQDFIESNLSINFGAMAEGDRNSLSRATKTRPVVMPSEIQILPDLTAYLKICDLNPALVHVEYCRYPEKNQPTDCEIPSLSYQTEQSESDEENPFDFDLDDAEAILNGEESKPKASESKANKDETADYDFDPDEFLSYE